MRRRWGGGGNCLLLVGLRKRSSNSAAIRLPETGANICDLGCLTVPARVKTMLSQFAVFGIGDELNHVGESSHWDCNPGKMIVSIVLALFLFCQSIDISGCLLNDTRVNSTNEQISQRRMKRSLTFPDPATLLVRNRLIASPLLLTLLINRWSSDKKSYTHTEFYTLFEKILANYECIFK